MDEHLSPEVADSFREAGFRVIEVGKNRKLAGRDEGEGGYQRELRKERGVFVTSDREHVDRVRAGREKHPGVVLLSGDWNHEAKVALARVIAETIKVGIREGGSMGLYNVVLVPKRDGLYFSEADGKERLFMSWVRYLGFDPSID